MCRNVQSPTTTKKHYYYEAKERINEDTITTDIIGIFHASHQNYGPIK